VVVVRLEVEGGIPMVGLMAVSRSIGGLMCTAALGLAVEIAVVLAIVGASC
jgi:hypothetical protein